MPRTRSLKPIPVANDFSSLFLSELLATAAGVEAAGRSIKTLGKLALNERYCDARDRIHAYFDSLKPFRRFGDFQGLAILPGPKPLHLHVEPHILHGHFRAWLRKQQLDPDRLARRDRTHHLPGRRNSV
jgi:hypothetical protein